jgi:hypothetical protein
MPAFTVARKSRKAWPGATVSPKMGADFATDFCGTGRTTSAGFLCAVTDPISQIAAYPARSASAAGAEQLEGQNSQAGLRPGAVVGLSGLSTTALLLISRDWLAGHHDAVVHMLGEIDGARCQLPGRTILIGNKVRVSFVRLLEASGDRYLKRSSGNAARAHSGLRSLRSAGLRS